MISHGTSALDRRSLDHRRFASSDGARAVTIKSRDENPAMTRLGSISGRRNLRIASIRIGTSEPVFTRTVAVATPELSEEKLHEQTLSSAVLYRLDLKWENRSASRHSN